MQKGVGKINKKLLVICGPTATGKTALAARLAKRIGGELVSADSRQVYKYMDIGTGKDRPKGIKIWGYDLVRPDQEFSVSQYVNFAHHAIAEIYSRKNLPILVGGTGLYIKAVVYNLDRINIPRDLKLRKRLAKKTTSELFALLMKIYPNHALKLNSSDRANPRRLVRLLEVLDYGGAVEPREHMKFDSVLWIGLRTNKDELKRRIDKRVDERVKDGFERELEFLKKKDLFRYVPSATIGYKDWPDVDKWKSEEFKYAKRQMTWFKKDPHIKWFDVSGKDYVEEIEKLVRKWHNK